MPPSRRPGERRGPAITSSGGGGPGTRARVMPAAGLTA